MKITAKILLSFLIFSNAWSYANCASEDADDDFIKNTESRNGKNYFEIDLSTFETRFEKVYFIMQLYHYNEVVIISSNPESKFFEITSVVSFPISHIKTMVKGIRKDTYSKSEEFSADQQVQWLKENDKFKRM